MKVLIWHMIFFCFVNSAFPQNNIHTTKANGLSNQRWDLDRYVWSYTHNNKVENDKAKIDFDAIDNWEGPGKYLTISNNGKYFAYTLERGIGLPGKYRKLDSLKVQSTSSPWCRAFAIANPGFFTTDDKQYIFQVNDTLCLLQLGTQNCKAINNVESYKITEERNNWIAYKYKNDNSVVLKNLLSEKELRYSGIASYSFDKSGKWFICQFDASVNKLLIYNLDTYVGQAFASVKSYLFSSDGNSLLLYTGNELKYYNSPEHSLKTIWTTNDTSAVVSAFQFDGSGTQVGFTVEDKSHSIPVNSIWYYNHGTDHAIIKGNAEIPGIPENLKIQEVSFTDNDHYIHLILESRQEPLPAINNAVQLDVWNYKDLHLQSEQSSLSRQFRILNGIINIENGHMIILENDHNKTLYELHGDYAIINKSAQKARGGRFWEKGVGFNEDSNWVVSLRDGSSRLLPTNGETVHFWFSPGGRYLVYFDTAMACHYFSYDLGTGKLRDISTDLPGGDWGYSNSFPFLITDEKPKGPFGPAAWLQNDAGLLVYDKYDIWKLDLAGNKPAVNITNHYGRKNSTIFSLMNGGRINDDIPVLKDKESLLLRAFNTTTKYNGFYRKTTFTAEDPELLSMEPYFMRMIPWIQDPNLSKDGLQPVKARKAAVWIVQRQSTIDAPNYYKTVDFRSFKRLTDFQPQKKYNWLSEELHSFKHLDGRTGQAILYKPGNFDSSKKYPVLIIFYGGYANNLYQFPVPAYNDEAITPGESPNWLLNNGYLIFTPDIYVAPLKYGPEAFNVIEGAAKYLKQLPYVDSNKLGFCAHSWSAKLGSYIFTHSKSFSAVGISEGFLYADMLNVAFSTDDEEISTLETVENGFDYGNLWKHKDLWLDQITVLNVDKAKSALLLLCNKASSKEYQNQTLQLFTALRRLDKKVWWLKYDKGSHRLTELNEEKDFTIRYTQFFDHYLKEAPAPRWMTQGIPFKLRGIESGYELDPGGKCGKDCRICEKWNQQYNKYPEMFQKAVSEWRLAEDNN